jgi:hypothetical protein
MLNPSPFSAKIRKFPRNIPVVQKEKAVPAYAGTALKQLSLSERVWMGRASCG